MGSNIYTVQVKCKAVAEICISAKNKKDAITRAKHEFKLLAWNNIISDFVEPLWSSAIIERIDDEYQTEEHIL